MELDGTTIIMASFALAVGGAIGYMYAKGDFSLMGWTKEQSGYA